MGLRTELSNAGPWRGTLIVIAEAIAAVKLVASVARLLPRLSRSQAILLYNGGGFGHSVLSPDLWRRLNPGRRCAVLFHMRGSRYNRRLPLLWPDVDLIMLDTSIVIRLPFAAEFHWVAHSAGRLFQSWLPRVLGRLLKGREIVPARRMMAHLLPRRLAEPEFSESMPDLLESRNWLPRYLRLLSRTSGRPAAMSAEVRGPIDGAIAPLAAPLERRACLYLRRKGTIEAKDDESIRSGSALQEYRPALEWLRGRGFAILLVGDVTDAAMADAGMADLVITSKRAGIEAELFYVSAATSADIFIGEAGGGSWLPALAQIPSLIVNMYPYPTALPGALHYYKTVRDVQGERADARNLFAEERGPPSSRYVVVDNDAQDLLSAVSDFVDGDPCYPAKGIDVATVAGLPADSWCASARAQISPAWWAKYVDAKVREAREPKRAS